MSTTKRRLTEFMANTRTRRVSALRNPSGHRQIILDFLARAIHALAPPTRRNTALTRSSTTRLARCAPLYDSP